MYVDHPLSLRPPDKVQGLFILTMYWTKATLKTPLLTWAHPASHLEKPYGPQRTTLSRNSHVENWGDGEGRGKIPHLLICTPTEAAHSGGEDFTNHQLWRRTGEKNKGTEEGAMHGGFFVCFLFIYLFFNFF